MKWTSAIAILRSPVVTAFPRIRSSRRLDVRTDAVVVTLTGQPTIGASAKASEIARGVPGVKSVKNELTFTG